MGFSANEVSGGADASYNGRTDAIPAGKKSRPELYCDTIEGRKGERRCYAFTIKGGCEEYS